MRFFLDGEEWYDSVFAEAAETSLAAPQTFLSDLFGIRADALLNGMPSGVSRAHLSGLILGLELEGARAEWEGRSVIIMGDGKLSDLYRRLLAAHGSQAEIVDAEVSLCL